MTRAALTLASGRALRGLVALSIVASTPAGTGALQEKHAGISDPPEKNIPGPPVSTPAWYSGDTHEHVQSCDLTVHPIEEIRERMDAENLNIASVLVWDFPENSFAELICNVTGASDPHTSNNRILQYGVETSYLTCARWGHLIGLNIGPNQARIVPGSLAAGACADMSGVDLGGDGSGYVNAPIARRFLTSSGAVCGYAHSVWTMGLYHTRGYDWNGQLLATGFTTDAAYMDPSWKLAVPDVPKLMGIGYPLSAMRAFLPLLGPMDAALGNVQFVETVVAALDLPINVSPRAHWTELYYKLLSAGVRVALAGGTDRACLTVGTGGVDDYVRTYVLAEEFSYDAWTKGLAAGRTTIAAGPDKFLRLSLDGVEAGSEVHLSSPAPWSTATVEFKVTGAIDDCIELVVNGEVRDARPVSGSETVVFEDVPFSESSWVAARLCSQRAHTGAIYVIVDEKPIVDPVAAEYWMLWCDIVTKTVLDHLEIGFFGRQRAETLARTAQARRAFKTLRDVHGFDPDWGVTRYGTSSAACRGPIAIGSTGPARSGESLLLTCVNAPPQADGVLYLSREADAGDCDGEIFSYVKTDPESLVGTLHVLSTRSGYAEVLVPDLPGGDPVLHAQFVWINPPGCASTACGGGAASRSASDALSLVVRVPILTEIEVTPTNPSIALGTTEQFTAMGTYDSGSTQDLTAVVTWSSTTSSVASVSNAPGSQGLATSASVGTTTIAATDSTSGVNGTSTLTVTPAVLVSIEVTPANASIALGTTAQFTAMGVFGDGTVQDLTGEVDWSSTNAAVAGVSNAPGSRGLAASISVGTTTIIATDSPSGISGATTLTVTPAVLTEIEVTPTNPSIALGTTAQFTAMAVFSDGTVQDLSGAVVWTSTLESVASVSNDPGSAGLATGVSVGITTIAATDPASGISGATTLTITPAVLTAIEVTPTNPSIALGTTLQLTATGIYTDASIQDLTSVVVWSSTSESVADVSNAPGTQGLATSMGIGTTTIAATDPGSAIGGTTMLEVTPAVLTLVEVTPTNPSIALGLTQQFTAMGIYTDATLQDLTSTVTWSSSSPSVASVSNAPGSAGLATSISAGETTITATDPGSALSGATVLAVTPALLVSLQVTPVDPSIPLGTTQHFSALGTYTDGSTQDLTDSSTWSSASDAIATVSNAPLSHGRATSVAVGETTITATDPESGIGDATTLTVTPAELVSLLVTPANPSIALGTTQQLTATGTYTDGTTQDLTSAVTWSSLDDSVATVSNAPGSHGFATSVAVGTTLISAADPATSIGGATVLTVTPAALVSIAVSPVTPSIVLGLTGQFTAIGTYTDATTQDLTTSVTWSSSSPGVATVSNAPGSEGLATSVSVGAATISAIDPESGVSGAAVLTVTPALLVSIQVLPTNPTIALGTAVQLSAIGTYTDATTQDLTASVAWSSESPAVATVSNAPGSEGLATSVSAGATTISATDPASSISAATTLTVEAVLLSIDLAPVNPGVVLGNTKQFTAMGNYNDGSTQDLTASVAWSSSSPIAATISSAPGTEGLAIGLSVGITTITATDLESGINRATTLRVISQH